jgi:hypothetical protein
LEPPDNTSDENVKNQVVWEGKGNAYSNFKQMLDQQPIDQGMPAPPISPEKWKNFTTETDPRIINHPVKFTSPPNLENLARACPSDFLVRDLELQQFGVEIKSLPVPEGKSESRNS